MTSDKITEIPGANDWTMGFTVDGLEIEFRWREVIYGDRSLGYWGRLIDLSTGEVLHFDGGDQWKEQALRNAAATFRVAELREELNLKHRFLSRDSQKEVILELFERSQQEEYLGQLSPNPNFYVQELAPILDLDLGYMLGLIDELSMEGKIGLNGMILIPHEDQEKTFAHWERQTGHRRLLVSDFGNWGCSACGQHGDEYENPRDFPCVNPTKEQKEDPDGIQ